MGSFQIQNKKIAGQDILQITRRDSDTWLSIFPNYGGALHELVVDGQPILETAHNAKTFETRTQKAFAGTQLCPFPNRIRGGKFTFRDESFQLKTNDPAGNNALHGLVYDQRFEMSNIDEKTGAAQLSYAYEGHRAGYPFRFKLLNTYRLLQDGFSVHTHITNDGDKTLPMGHGWHPYFSIGGAIEEARLQISSKAHYPIAADFLPSGKMEEHKTYQQFAEIGKAEFNHCFLIEKEVLETAKLHFPSKNLTVRLFTENYHFLQVYVPPSRQSIALEPQSCIPDAFNNGIGLLQLQPQKSISFDLKISVEKNN